MDVVFNIYVLNIQFQQFILRLVVVVMIWNFDNIFFINCVFKDNDCFGINVFDSGIIIEGCFFLNNILNLQKFMVLESCIILNIIFIFGGVGFVFDYVVN